MNTNRVYYDSENYYIEKSKLSNPDGISCIICRQPFDKPDKRKSYCSKECFSKWYDSIKVNNWSKLREHIIKRDGKCINCGVGVENNAHISFEVHHINPICEGGEEFNTNNCITLCYNCHKEMHTIIGKRKRINCQLDEFMIKEKPIV